MASTLAFPGVLLALATRLSFTQGARRITRSLAIGAVALLALRLSGLG